MAEVIIASAAAAATAASTAASAAAASITWASVGSALMTAAVSTTISVGISFLASSLRNKKSTTSSPSDVQTTIRQAVAPRVTLYGKGRLGGVYAFIGSKEGNLHKVQVLCSHRIDEFEEYWIDDEQVYLNTSSQVINDPDDPRIKDNSRFLQIHQTTTPYIYRRIGVVATTAYPQLTDVFPEWTSDHIGRGMATIYTIQPAIGEKDFYNIYPNGVNTNYNCVVRGKLMSNPIGGGSSVYSDNAIEVIHDYLRYESGMRLPANLFTTPKALAGLLNGKNVADQVYNLKSTGTEPRYRLWGSYTSDERPADVLERMFSSCDARWVPTSDGGLYIEPGYWIEPTTTLDESCITSVTSLSRGKDVTETANVINAQFVNPDADYVESDADPWINEESVALRGEITEEFQFLMSPSHAQTRRLMKIKSYEADPKWKGTFTCNLKALSVYGDRFVRINYPKLGINNETFKLQTFKMNIGEGNILQSVTIEVISMPEEAYQWDYLTEEGTAPVDEDIEVVDDIPLPTGFGATIVTRNVSGKEAPFARLEWDTVPSLSLNTELRGRKVGETNWQRISVETGETTADSFALSDGESYEFEINFISITGRKGDSVSYGPMPAIADTIAPPQVTGFSATGGAGEVTFNYTSPNSNRFSGINLYRNNTNSIPSSPIDTIYGAPSASFTTTNGGLTAGTYYFWITSRNFSGVETTPKLASGAVVVT